MFLRPLLIALIGALPAVVGPEVELWGFFYAVFEQLHATLCQFILRQFVGRCGDGYEGGGVVSALWALDFEEERHLVELAREALRTGEDAGVVVEERHPEVDVLVAWALIEDVAHEVVDAVALQGDYLAQYVALVDALTAVGGAYIEHQSVGGLVAQGVIDESLDGVGVARGGEESDVGEPLPVAVVSHEDGYILSSVPRLIDEFDVVEAGSAAHLVVGDVDEFCRLNEVVAQPAVELALDVLYLLLGFFGEGGGEVFADDAAPVSYYVIQEDVDYV